MAEINILLAVFDRRSSMIVMLSLCTGGVAYYPGIARNLLDAVEKVLSSGIATGAFIALFLNLVLSESATLTGADLTNGDAQREVSAKRSQKMLIYN